MNCAGRLEDFQGQVVQKEYPQLLGRIHYTDSGAEGTKEKHGWQTNMGDSMLFFLYPHH
jgi:hypothetical protein